MNSPEEKPVSQICVDTEKLTQLLTALTECMETGEFDRAHACIHELTLKNGRRCQVIIEIEEEDEKGNFPSDLQLKSHNAVVKTQH